MAQPLYTYADELHEGRFVGRPNRFTVDVSFAEGPDAGGDDEIGSDPGSDTDAEPVYLRNSGGMETVLDPGRRVLCRYAASPDRKTEYDAIAVDVDGTWVTVDATLPNRLVEAALESDRLPWLAGYEVERTEPALPNGGRADLRCSSPAGRDAYVEVKSNTYVVDGVSKFPDRPTERGRRHLRHLADLAETDGVEAYIVFVVQRPDVDRVRPFTEVDPEFAALLAAAIDRGVTVRAIATAFQPPAVTLSEPDVPVVVD